MARASLPDGELPLVPAGVLAQAGARQANLARLLKGCQVVALDAGLARAAGESCGACGTWDAIDATVAIVAL